MFFSKLEVNAEYREYFARKLAEMKRAVDEFQNVPSQDVSTATFVVRWKYKAKRQLKNRMKQMVSFVGLKSSKEITEDEYLHLTQRRRFLAPSDIHPTMRVFIQMMPASLEYAALKATNVKSWTVYLTKVLMEVATQSYDNVSKLEGIIDMKSSLLLKQY
jgi:hypothetical protein